MAKHLSNKLIELILSDLKINLSERKIAEKFKISKTTVNRIRKMTVKGEDFTSKRGSGRLSKLSSRDKQILDQQYKKDHFTTRRKYKKVLEEKSNNSVNISTISRYFKRENMISHVAVSKPLLSKINIQKRFNRAEEFLGLSKEEIDSIIFTDETKINLFNSDGRLYVRFKPGEKYNLKNLQPTIKFGGGKIMLWGCISSKGVGRIVFIKENMRSENYKTILADNLQQSADEMDLKNFIFMQDNDPKHKSRMVMNYIESKGWKMLDWPPQSPDLNPIENVWRLLKLKLGHLGFISRNEIEEKVREAWYSIKPEEIKQYIDSFRS